MDVERDEEEYRALTLTLLGFYNFHQWEYEQLIKPRVIKYQSLTQAEKDLLPWYSKFTEDLKLCININMQFTQNLAMTICRDWGVSPNPKEWYPATSNEYEKVRGTLMQLSREWSSDGEHERLISYGRIVRELTEFFPEELARQNVKVLVPGCGLGRLVVELVRKGFWCQGNEFSYHMLLTSNYILNHSPYAHMYSIMPYLHKSSHLTKRSNQTHPVTVPDSNPTDINELFEKNPHIPYHDLMSMAAGSFVDLYGAKKSAPDSVKDNAAEEFRSTNASYYDVVATTFFLDTASNIIEYIKTVHNCLKEGGIWINFGPLLWHFEDDYNVKMVQKEDKQVPLIMKGLELSRDDLIELIEKMGFKFEKRESNIESTYSNDIRALGAFVYQCEFWICRKVTVKDD